MTLFAVDCLCKASITCVHVANLAGAHVCIHLAQVWVLCVIVQLGSTVEASPTSAVFTKA